MGSVGSLTTENNGIISPNKPRSGKKTSNERSSGGNKGASRSRARFVAVLDELDENYQDKIPSTEISPNIVSQLAHNYRFSDSSISDLCDHNASVASNLKLHKITQMWKILKIIYGETENTQIYIPLSKEKKISRGETIFLIFMRQIYLLFPLFLLHLYYP